MVSNWPCRDVCLPSFFPFFPQFLVEETGALHPLEMDRQSLLPNPLIALPLRAVDAEVGRWGIAIIHSVLVPCLPVEVYTF